MTDNNLESEVPKLQRIIQNAERELRNILDNWNELTDDEKKNKISSVVGRTLSGQ